MNFEEKCIEIEKQIKEIKGDNKDIQPISDGIINSQKYLAAKFKILWILKESNDVIDNVGGGWDLPKAIEEKKCWEEQKGAKLTFRRMIYATYGILNNFILWKEIPNIYNKEVFEAIKEIAFINIKKIPGGSIANETSIQQAYSEHKELLINQIETYNPDIVITGNTLQYFFDDLSINRSDRKYACEKTKNTAYYPYPKRLYIHAWHPAYFKVKEEVYCNEIILAAKDWVNNIREN